VTWVSLWCYRSITIHRRSNRYYATLIAYELRVHNGWSADRPVDTDKMDCPKIERKRVVTRDTCFYCTAGD
ncbi:uncharacterized protein BT62DRAFT_936590, partial [Guyanagaster necrorhizus]